MKNSNIAIVVVTYNRPNSLKRLLNALSASDYPKEVINLIISIDNSRNKESQIVAENFQWNHGNKIIINHPIRLGLRSHILKCGEFLNDYDAIIVFEDDIYPSPSYYHYSKQAFEFYKNDENIAGISLYTHNWSEYNSRPFTPAKNSYDNFFIQYAQSWGQVWLKKQWGEFVKWYKDNKDDSLEATNLPLNVSNWPESSWLKFHIKYCIDNEKYFVYPYHSLCTNFTEIGQHNDSSSTTYQVPFITDIQTEYKFQSFSKTESAVIYDAFFERKFTTPNSEISHADITIDIYGKKYPNINTRYLISTLDLNFLIKKKFGLRLRPHEINYILNVPGDSIFLYDLHHPTNKKSHSIKKNTLINEWVYDVKSINYKIILLILFRKFLSKLTPYEIWISLKYKIKFLTKNLSMNIRQRKGGQ